MTSVDVFFVATGKSVSLYGVHVNFFLSQLRSFCFFKLSFHSGVGWGCTGNRRTEWANSGKGKNSWEIMKFVN